MWDAVADLVVVGSGVAGLSAALEAARCGLRTVVVSKGAAEEGNTRWAQGGLAVVLPDSCDEHDSLERHIHDTVAAGAGLCDVAAVTSILGDGAAGFAAMQRFGARFDLRDDGSPARTREGGHTAFRIVRAGGDATGAEIERALVARVGSGTILERHAAVDVVRTAAGSVAGLLVLDHAGVLGLIHTPAVLLATGGAGQLYESTSNDAVATADGLALGLRAGAEVGDVEFVQFHPTVLYTGRATVGSRPLVTEALRGEGAVLIDATGASVMAGVHPLADLAPRDVVSTAITRRLADSPGGVDDHVYLDATHLTTRQFRARFPTVYASCANAGIDPATDPIPVAPAAHYSCGGLVTTVDGRTSVRGLYAAGETARTGLHGANRLASNSLIEGFIVGTRAARAATTDRMSGIRSRHHDAGDISVPSVEIADRPTLQRVMTAHGAIGRRRSGLTTITDALDATVTVRPIRTRTDIEDAALALTARVFVAAAHEREETRGCHVRLDHPRIDDRRWRRSLFVRLDHHDRPTLLDAPRRQAA